MGDPKILELARRAIAGPLGDWDGYLDRVNYESVLYRRFLYLLCREFRLRTAVELGVNNGGTTVHLAAGVSHKAVGVEVNPNFALIATTTGELPAELGMKMDIVVGDSRHPSTRNRAIGLLEPYPTADLLFIDSEHKASVARSEWKLWGPYVTPGGWVVMDDIEDPPEMWEVFESIPGIHTSLPDLHRLSGDPRHGQSVGFGVIKLDG